MDVRSEAPAPHLQRAREIVLRYGWNATAYQIINPGIRLWFSAKRDAVVGFVEHNRVRVVAGAPVCQHEHLPAVSAEFEHSAASAGSRVCYFGAEARLMSIYRDAPTHSLVVLGAQPVWDPAGWPDILAHRASLRAQLNRARNKAVQVSEWPWQQAQGNPELHRCLQEWLAARGLPPLHFLVEPETLERLYDRRIFVAEQAQRVIGFLVASPVPERNGWLVEQIIRGRDAPNGTSELLIDAAMRAAADEGLSYVTLGLAPLSRRANIESAPNPRWLRFTLAWVRAHGRRFYNFDGLDAFKAKLQPDRWEPVYAISNEQSFSPPTLYAIASAFSSGSPLLLIARALLRAVRQEIDWLLRRRKSAPGKPGR